MEKALLLYFLEEIQQELSQVHSTLINYLPREQMTNYRNVLPGQDGLIYPPLTSIQDKIEHLSDLINEK